ncbi:RNA polymerase ECF family sigma subunit [Prauserella shujinwangii]|uniref:RNA polymerase ECF family sigma subunit n=1 Tax=Prauserella shujinwangii TaxID=1453103 RepID=A0A2T0LQ35_9PSEU|nr:sigma-70 family RNA polymerase sigma factor [Prauserella shujinwangii]PRX45439.1 RNA polymerase ECF family sigma subunit [Prauserella shujinwangii]
MSGPHVEDLLRRLAPQVLGAVTRRYGHFDVAEDAVQEALLAAATRWPEEGLPDSPRSWLIAVAARRMTDLLRAEQARRRREEAEAVRMPRTAYLAPAADAVRGHDHDDTLVLLFLCCHPALSPGAQVPLTLRAVGGLTTAEIAGALLLPEATVAKRITRAKQRIRDSGTGFRLPPPEERGDRLATVLHVLYLVFNEGYTSVAEPAARSRGLADEAIRLTRELHRLLPDDDEVSGLLALMLLTHARRAARTRADGSLVPLAEQDRSRWDQAAIAEGSALVARALRRTRRFTSFQLQAAIAAVHDEAERAEDTDWPQIVALYELLRRVSDNPVVTLNHAVAVGMVRGPAAGLAMLEPLDEDSRVADHHRLDAVRAHLLELAGDHPAARVCYERAARRTASEPERRYLAAKAAELAC